MIFTVNQILLSGKKYSISVSCRSTRRLTTVEWMILRLVKDFSEKGIDYNIGFAFENVLNIQNCDLLLKPSFEELQRLNVIRLANKNFDNYSKLKFNEIKLTEEGEIMLSKGLKPGELRQLNLNLHFNPILDEFNKRDQPQKGMIVPEINLDNNVSFPKEKIIKLLQNGQIDSEKFVASQYIIEDIDVINEEDIKLCSNVVLNIENHVITTTPYVHSSENIKIVEAMIYNSIFNKKETKKLKSIEDDHVHNIYGTGSRIQENILKFIQKNKIIFIKKSTYDSLNPMVFDDRKVIIFDPSINEKTYILEGNKLTLPLNMLDDNCLMFSINGDHISVSKVKCNYNDAEIIVPFAYFDNRIEKSSIIAWINSLLDKKINTNFSFIILGKLANISKEKIISLIKKAWEKKSFEEIILNIEYLNEFFSSFEIDCDFLESLQFILIEKAKDEDVTKFLLNVGTLAKVNIIEKNSEIYISLINAALLSLPEFETYNDLATVMRLLKINSHQDAIMLNTDINNFYNRKVISNVISFIVQEKYEQHDSILELDCLFNDYVDCINRIKIYLNNHSLFEKIEKEDLQSFLDNNIDIVGLNLYIQKIREKNTELTKYGVNVFNEMEKYEKEKTSNFINNINEIEKMSDLIINKTHELIINSENHSIQDTKNIQLKDMYFIDTCALIHQPDIFSYFKEDEYINIPIKVIEELGKIKDSWNTKSYGSNEKEIARRLSKEIVQMSGNYNKNIKCRFNISKLEENKFPVELDPNVPDNVILAIILQYPQWRTHLITDDNQFKIMASTYGIIIHSSLDFIESHKKQPLNNNRKITNPEKDKKQENNKCTIKVSNNIRDRRINELEKYNISKEEIELLMQNGIRYFEDLEGKSLDDFKKFKANKKYKFVKNGLEAKFNQLIKLFDSLT